MSLYDYDVDVLEDIYDRVDEFFTKEKEKEKEKEEDKK